MGAADMNVMTLNKLKIPTRYICLVFFVFVLNNIAFANFNEQVAIDTRAISLGNAVTADPPGLMSVHYNPAGLSMLGEGKIFSNGVILAHIIRKGTFTENPDFPGFMNGQWAPSNRPENWPNYDPNDPTAQTTIDPNSDHGGPDPIANTTGTNSSNQMYLPFYGPIPLLGGANLGISSRKAGSKFTFAYANYAPYAAGYVHGDKDDPYRFGAKSLYNQHFIYAAPSIACELSDTFSVGASIGIGQRALGVEVDVRTPNELVALTRVLGDATESLDIPILSAQTLPAPWLGGGLGPYEHVITLELIELRDDFSPSFNLGLLWKPKEWFSFGACYQSKSVAELSGQYKWKYSEQFQKQVNWNGQTEMTIEGAGMLDLPFIAVAEQSGTATTTQIFPQRFQTGVMIKPFSKLKLLIDVGWSNWSVIKEDRFTFDQRIQILRIAKLLGYVHGANDYVVERNMRDTWNWCLGLEYQVLDNFALRMGVEDRPTSLNEDQFDAMYFVPSARLYGTGFGLKLHNGINLDVSLGWLKSDDIRIENNGSTNLNSTDFTKMGNAYAGLDYEQEASIYIASFAVTMPLEVQVEMLHHQMEMVKHQIENIKHFFGKLNPFKKDEDE